MGSAAVKSRAGVRRCHTSSGEPHLISSHPALPGVCIIAIDSAVRMRAPSTAVPSPDEIAHNATDLSSTQ